MIDDVICELTKLKIKEYEKSKKVQPKKYTMTKEQLINFCIKMMKVICNVEDIFDNPGEEYDRRTE